MIDPQKLTKAIKVIQDLVIVGRTLAYEGCSSQFMAEYLDHLEYLPGLMLEEKDQTDFFEEYLRAIVVSYKCPHVLVWYEKND